MLLSADKNDPLCLNAEEAYAILNRPEILAEYQRSFPKIEREACALVRMHWERIERLASELKEKMRLDKNDLEDFFRRETTQGGHRNACFG